MGKIGAAARTAPAAAPATCSAGSGLLQIAHGGRLEKRGVGHSWARPRGKKKGSGSARGGEGPPSIRRLLRGPPGPSEALARRLDSPTWKSDFCGEKVGLLAEKVRLKVRLFSEKSDFELDFWRKSPTRSPTFFPTFELMLENFWQRPHRGALRG